MKHAVFESPYHEAYELSAITLCTPDVGSLIWAKSRDGSKISVMAPGRYEPTLPTRFLPILNDWRRIMELQVTKQEEIRHVFSPYKGNIQLKNSNPYLIPEPISTDPSIEPPLDL